MADQRGASPTPRRVEQRERSSRPAPRRSRAARRRCCRGPAGRRASTAWPWCANQRASSVQTLWSCIAAVDEDDRRQAGIEGLAAGVGVGGSRPPTRSSISSAPSRRLQRALQVVDQVVGILEADRQADRARADAGLRQRRVVHAEVRGRAPDGSPASWQSPTLARCEKMLQRLDEAPALPRGRPCRSKLNTAPQPRGSSRLRQRVVGMRSRARDSRSLATHRRARPGTRPPCACSRRAAPCAAAGSRCPAGSARRCAGSCRRRSRAGPRAARAAGTRRRCSPR